MFHQMNGYQRHEILKKISFIISSKIKLKIKEEHMALVPCPECKKEISDISKSCPSCGFPMSEYTRNQLNSNTPPPLPPPLPSGYLDVKKSSSRTNIFTKMNNYSREFFLWSLIIVILLLLFSTVATPKKLSKEPQTKAEPILKNTTPEPKPKPEINYLQTTATKMINTYKNNEVRADNIYKDTHIEVTGIVSSIDSDLSNNAVINLASKNEYEFNFVMASGDLDFQKKATSINKGQIITLRCIGGGEVIGNPILNECTFK